MRNGIRQREVKFPENKKIGARLNQGDRVVIAEYAGLKPGTIRDMLNGYLRITDKAARAIIKLMYERQELDRALEQITNQ